MISVKRFYDPKLAQVSYMIGSTDTRSAAIIDANRDVDQYIRSAAEEGLAITHVTETHIHADFVSGSRELAARTGAQLYLSDEGDADWKYAFAAEAGAVPLRDGDTIEVGSVRLTAVHTPGHTPEHLMFLVTDTAVIDEPLAAVTGDFVFAGDVGRPDLLERAARVVGSMDSAARALFGSLQRLRAHPDHLQIWPGHGAGSSCGKGIGALPQTTLGYERRTNWALRPMSEDEFVQRVLEGQPAPPTYYAEMKRINKEGPRPLDSIARPERVTLDRLAALLSDGATVVDTRSAADFAEAHLVGSINIPMSRSFTTWAGWLLPYTRDFFLIIEQRCGQCLQDAVHDLAMIGLDRLGGYADADVIAQWQARGGKVGRIAQVDATTLARQRETGEVEVLDVRSAAEFAGGHVPGARNVPLGDLSGSLDALPTDRPIIVHCQGGARSAIAASLLDAHGFSQVRNLAGGFNEWMSTGQPVDTGVAARPSLG